MTPEAIKAQLQKLVRDPGQFTQTQINWVFGAALLLLVEEHSMNLVDPELDIPQENPGGKFDIR